MVAGKYWMLIGGLGLCLFAGLSLPRTEPKRDACGISTEPIVSLDYGSRYTDGSKNRSNLDEAGNEAVDKALGPVDDFIQDLSRLAGSALTESDQAKSLIEANCVFSAVHQWAKANALSDLQSQNANLSSPSRIGGIAAAFSQIEGLVQDRGKERDVINNWFNGRAEAIIAFFENDAPQKASKNNLRAWAGFTVGEIGILTKNQRFIDWAIQGNSAMIAAANPDGSLPLEMARGKYALHYQLHATAALVASTARLCASGSAISGEYLAGLDKIAEFSLAAIQNSQIIEDVAGEAQKKEEFSKKKTSSLAWIEAYSALKGRDMVPASLAQFRPLTNSKLGGALTRFYNGKTISCAPLLAG